MGNSNSVGSGDSPFTFGEDVTNMIESEGVFGAADKKLLGKGTSVLDMNPNDSIIGAFCKVTNQKGEINAFDMNKNWDGIGKKKGNGQGIGIG